MEQRSRRDEEPERILDRVHAVDQVFALDEIEQLQVVLDRCPRREGHPGRPEVDPDGACCGKRGADVRPDFDWNRTAVGGMGYR